MDAERIVGDDAEAARIARGHGEWGVGRISLDDVRTIGEGDVTHNPVDGNPAHCALTILGKRKLALAQACEITVAPTARKWVIGFAGLRRE